MTGTFALRPYRLAALAFASTREASEILRQEASDG